MVPDQIFMVPGQFSWLFMVLGWFFLVPGRFSWFQVGFHGSRSVFMIFDSSRLVFHGSRSVFMVFCGSRLVFHGSRLVFMVFHGFRLVFHDFSWFQVGFSWFFSKYTCPNCILARRLNLVMIKPRTNGWSMKVIPLTSCNELAQRKGHNQMCILMKPPRLTLRSWKTTES